MISKEKFEELKRIYKASMDQLDNVEEYISSNSWDEDWKHIFQELIELYEVTVIESNKFIEEYQGLEDFNIISSVSEYCLECDLAEIKYSVDYLVDKMRNTDENMNYDLYFSDKEDMEEIGYTDNTIDFLEESTGLRVYRG